MTLEEMNQPHAVVDMNGNLIAIAPNRHCAESFAGHCPVMDLYTRPATEHDVLTMLERVK